MLYFLLTENRLNLSIRQLQIPKIKTVLKFARDRIAQKTANIEY